MDLNMPLYSVLTLLTQIVKVMLLASLLCNSFTQLELVFPTFASVDVIFTVEMCRPLDNFHYRLTG